MNQNSLSNQNSHTDRSHLANQNTSKVVSIGVTSGNGCLTVAASGPGSASESADTLHPYTSHASRSNTFHHPNEALVLNNNNDFDNSVSNAKLQGYCLNAQQFTPSIFFCAIRCVFIWKTGFLLWHFFF